MAGEISSVINAYAIQAKLARPVSQAVRTNSIQGENTHRTAAAQIDNVAISREGRELLQKAIVEDAEKIEQQNVQEKIEERIAGTLFGK